MVPERQKQQGYIALMSAIVISLIMIGLTFGASQSGYLARFSALNGEFKRVSLGLAESCANAALLEIAQKPNTPLHVGEIVAVGAESCVIKTVDDPGTYDANHQKRIVVGTQASYKGAFSNIKISSTVQDPDWSPVIRIPLVVQVIMNNSYGHAAQPADFSVSIAAAGATVPPFAGDSSGSAPVYLDQGVSFDVTQTTGDPNIINNYNPPLYDNCSGSAVLDSGETYILCKITNKDKPTTAALSLKINQVTNDNGGTKGPGDFLLALDGNPVMNGQTVSVAVNQPHAVSVIVSDDYHIETWWSNPCVVNGDAANGTIGANELNAGSSYTCGITFDDNPPPTPECADTVMMLDRTGSMTDAYLADERNAAKSLLDLYGTVAPKVSVGVFGDGTDSNGLAPARIVGHLTNTYASLYGAIDTWLAAGSSGGYTNLQSAISKSQEELDTNGSHHGDGSSFEHVMIMLSDGETNRPDNSVQLDTGFKNPAANAQNASGDSWTDPAGAYGSGNANDNAGHRHRYQNFGFNLPADASISGIEAKVEGWADPVPVSADTGFVSPASQAPDTGGDGNGFEVSPANAYADGGNYASNMNGAADRHRYFGYNFNLPPDASITGIQVRPDWWLDNTSGTNSVNIELSWDGGAHWTALKNQSSESTSDTNNKTVGGAGDTWGRPWALSDFNSANFRVRIISNSSTSSRDFYLDWIPVKVFYNYMPASASCQLGVDLSWNGGANWSSEKTQTLPGTFGSASDKWGSHLWKAADFSDANFRVRIHDVNPGVVCRVDSIAAKVSYIVPVDPSQAALDAADSAKQNNTKIFTIHFGDAAGREYLAELASGDISYPPHEDGSFFDSSGVVTGDTGFISPSLQAADTGGDGNGFESAPANAYADSNGLAANIDGTGDRHQYYGYNFNLPPNAVINGIQVRPDWWTESTSGANRVSLELSWDGGAHWTALKNQSSESTSDTNNKTVGGVGDTWGHFWIAAEFSDLRVRITAYSTTASRDFYLDWIPVKVFYTVIQENADGDNFYISPSSADMAGIFKDIGKKVCPAAAIPVTPPATTGNLVVVNNVTNDNGRSKVAGDFQVTAADSAGQVLTPFSSLASGDGMSASYTYRNLMPGNYTVAEAPDSGYDVDLTQCGNGSIAVTAGDTVTCVVNNNDKPVDDPPPPPAPPPPANITIGGWLEGE